MPELDDTRSLVPLAAEDFSDGDLIPVFHAATNTVRKTPASSLSFNPLEITEAPEEDLTAIREALGAQPETTESVQALLPEINPSTSVLARFDYLSVSEIARGDSPEIGAPFQIASINANPNMTVLAGGGIVGSGTLVEAGVNPYWYLGNDPGQTVKSYVFEVEYREVAGGNPAILSGYTFAFHSSPVLQSGSPYGITLPSGMLHIQTNSAGISHFGYSTAPDATFYDIAATNEAKVGDVYSWAPSGAAVPIGKRFTIEFQFDGEECRVIAFGKAHVFRSPFIEAAAPRYWFIEDKSPANTSVGYYGVLHMVAIDSDKWRSQSLASQRLLDFATGEVIPSPTVIGGTATSSTLTLKGTSGTAPASGTAIRLAIGTGGAGSAFTADHYGINSYGNYAPITSPTNAPNHQFYGFSPLGQLMLFDSYTNSTTKTAMLCGAHYSTAWLSFSILKGVSDASANTLYWGGGNAGAPAATSHKFYTGANNTTTTGTLRMEIDSAGRITAPLTNYVDDTAAGIGGLTAGMWYQTLGVVKIKQ